MAMKRKTTVRCAAANDEDDLGALFDEAEERKSKSAKHSQSDACEADEALLAEVKPKRKEKAFAWMDSDDEDQDGDDEVAPNEGEKKEAREQISESTLDSVQSFGRMMLLVPELQKRLRSGDLSGLEMAAACRAIGRTKFFDGDLLEVLYPTLQQMLRHGKIDLQHVQDVVSCLWTINAYDKGVFCALAACSRSVVGKLSRDTREQFFSICKAFRHEEDQDFLQMLETPPLEITSLGYKKLRCKHFAAGGCLLANGCTFAHDMKAPLAVDELNGGLMQMKDIKRVVMTANQESMGNRNGVQQYGGSNHRQANIV